MLGLASAVHLGVLDFDEESYRIALPSGRTLSRQEFVGRVTDVALQAIVTLTDPRLSPQPPRDKLKLDPVLDVNQYRMVVRRDPRGAALTRVDRMADAAPGDADRIGYAYAPKPDAALTTSVYLTANGGFVLLTAANVLHAVLESGAAARTTDESRSAYRFQPEAGRAGSWRVEGAADLDLQLNGSGGTRPWSRRAAARTSAWTTACGGRSI